MVTTDPFFFTRVTQLVVLAARYMIPTLYSRREFAAAGGLMSYGPNINDSYRLLGVYAARILKGEKSGDLPIQPSTKFGHGAGQPLSSPMLSVNLVRRAHRDAIRTRKCHAKTGTSYVFEMS